MSERLWGSVVLSLRGQHQRMHVPENRTDDFPRFKILAYLSIVSSNLVRIDDKKTWLTRLFRYSWVVHGACEECLLNVEVSVRKVDGCGGAPQVSGTSVCARGSDMAEDAEETDAVCPCTRCVCSCKHPNLATKYQCADGRSLSLPRLLLQRPPPRRQQPGLWGVVAVRWWCVAWLLLRSLPDNSPSSSQ